MTYEGTRTSSGLEEVLGNSWIAAEKLKKIQEKPRLDDSKNEPPHFKQAMFLN